MDITAAVLTGPGRAFELAGLQLEEPRAGEVVVRLAATGVCHTDLVAAGRLRAGAPPAVYGHEGTGTVEAVGAGVFSVRPGDRVVLSYAWCGTCPNCARGRGAYCDLFLPLNYSGTRPDGTSAMSRDGSPVHAHFLGQSSWATHTVTTERNVVRVDADVPWELLAPLGCGVQTGAGAVLNVLKPEKGSSIAVFALGGVGLSAVMAARLAGCDRIVAVDPNPARRRLALELGADEAVEPADAPVDAVDYSVECLGKPDVVRAAVTALRLPGMCVTLGFQGRATPVELDQRALMSGRGIRGSIEGDAVPQEFIPRLIGHLRDGSLPLERLVGTRPFAQLNEAVADSVGGEVVKPVLLF